MLYTDKIHVVKKVLNSVLDKIIANSLINLNKGMTYILFKIICL